MFKKYLKYKKKYLFASLKGGSDFSQHDDCKNPKFLIYSKGSKETPPSYMKSETFERQIKDKKKEMVDTATIIIKNALEGVEITRINANQFNISALKENVNIKFFDTIFILLDEDGNKVYNDNLSSADNEKTIHDYIIIKKSISCILPLYDDTETVENYLRKITEIENLEYILSLVLLSNVFPNNDTEIDSDCHSPTNVLQPITKLPIIKFYPRFDELIIDLQGLDEIYYLNLFNYQNITIKKLTIRHVPPTLIKIILPLNSNIKEIGNNFLSESKIENINFSNLSHLETINNYFLASSDIEIINLQECLNLIAIGEWFLFNCKKIKKITLPINIKTIGKLFIHNSEIVDNVDLSECNRLFIIPPEFITHTKLKNIFFPINIKIIRNNSLTFSTVNSIDLSECKNLKRIDDQCFTNTSKLKNFFLPEESNIRYIGTYFLDKSVVSDIFNLEKCNKLEEITEGFLSTTQNLCSVILPPNIKKINEQFLYESSIQFLDLSKCLQLSKKECFAEDFLQSVKINVKDTCSNLGINIGLYPSQASYETILSLKLNNIRVIKPT